MYNTKVSSNIYGEMSELVEGARLEIVCTQKVPGVRISPSPPLEVISSAAKHH